MSACRMGEWHERLTSTAMSDTQMGFCFSCLLVIPVEPAILKLSRRVCLRAWSTKLH